MICLKVDKSNGLELRKDDHGVYWLGLRTSKDMTYSVKLVRFCGNTSHWDDLKRWADEQFKGRDNNDL